MEIKSQSNFQSLQEKHGKEHESDGIYVLDIKLNNTTSSISPSNFHVKKDVYRGPIVVEPNNKIVIASTCLGSPIKQVTANEQHLFFSKTEVLDTVMKKSCTLWFNEGDKDAMIQRILVKDL